MVYSIWDSLPELPKDPKGNYMDSALCDDLREYVLRWKQEPNGRFYNELLQELAEEEFGTRKLESVIHWVLQENGMEYVPSLIKDERFVKIFKLERPNPKTGSWYETAPDFCEGSFAFRKGSLDPETLEESIRKYEKNITARLETIK